jgi:uncharacterized cupin superfamily protein
MMSGEALEPYAEGVLASGFLETVTPHEPGQKMLAVYSGEIWVALFEFTGGENRAVFFPGDEFVYVVAGTLTLTDANSGEARTFVAGEYVFVPKGWQGSWANEGFYREVAVCSRDWLLPYERMFQEGIVDAERRKTFLPVDPRSAHTELGSVAPLSSAGDGVRGFSTRHILGSDLLIRVVACEGESSPTTFGLGRDVFVQVLDGGVALVGESGAREHFAREDCFVLSRDFGGSWQPSEDFVAVLVEAGVAT